MHSIATVDPSEFPMSPERPVARRRMEILNALGLHMRPANKFVVVAGRFTADVRVRYNGRLCDGKSIMDMMTLAAERGAVLEVEAEGPDAEQAVEALAELVAERFHETDEGWTEVEPS